ncbi:MAG: CsgG/HfaB family protein, partial [Deltaproteobacteria bacterium]|nr:CsgG/HfaB family protein [Deltaproteobacteria bacterium]
MMGDSGRHYRHIARCLRGGIVCALVLLAIAPSVRAAVDSEALATRIAESLQNTLRDSRYRTVAISRIREAKSGVDIDELIDLINVKIVRGRKFQVVDRSRLQLILREQKIQLSDFVSAEKYQELGKLMGVDLFIYGTFHGDGLVLKGIDVQNSAIAWADLFLFAHTPVTNFLSGLGQNVVTSIGKDLDRLRKAKVKLVSFWDINADSPFTSSAVMDYLSIALTQGGHFQVVDRENLRLITEEQKLNQEVFIDEKNAKRLGELYGVDAFIYGGITRRDKDTYRASLK